MWKTIFLFMNFPGLIRMCQAIFQFINTFSGLYAQGHQFFNSISIFLDYTYVASNFSISLFFGLHVCFNFIIHFSCLYTYADLFFNFYNIFLNYTYVLSDFSIENNNFPELNILCSISIKSIYVKRIKFFWTLI